MKLTVTTLAICLLSTAVFAQRPPMTPEQQAEAAKRREAEMAAPRPIDALDSVWMEELTWMEIRDAIKAHLMLTSDVADTRINATINQSYRRITSTLGGRLFKFGATVDF